jgi:hypothetical protein
MGPLLEEFKAQKKAEFENLTPEQKQLPSVQELYNNIYDKLPILVIVPKELFGPTKGGFKITTAKKSRKARHRSTKLRATRRR